MMTRWRTETKSDAQLVRRALAHFNQEQFVYTLNPPLLSQHTVDEFLFDTQRGFCEHYASAFTVMMRMAGIPARVVTGYQGGFFSNVGGYMLVRQSDAHAWSEVWLRGSGWTRIDPTAAVAPDRIEQSATDSLAGRRHMFDFDWLINVRNTFDLFQRGWNNWVVAFSADSQSRLLSMFGWGFSSTTKLIIAMIVIVLVIAAAIFMLAPILLRFRSTRNQDPMELAMNAGSQLEYRRDGIYRIARLYMLCRYSRDAGNQAELAQLIDSFQVRPA